MNEIFRSAFVIGRRDYLATVMSKTFLFFLLGPLFPIGLGILFGGVGEKIAASGDESIVAVAMSEADYGAIVEAQQQLQLLAGQTGFAKLERVEPEADRDALRDRLLERDEAPVLGVLDGTLEAPAFRGSVSETGRTVGQLSTFIDQARRNATTGADPPAGAPLDVEIQSDSASQRSFAQEFTARIGQLLIFFLTILLAGMLLSQMLEEKSNKAIEVLASAVPVDGIFLGKLFAMLAISLTGIVVWLSAGIAALFIFNGGEIGFMPPPPAVGWPLFIVLALVYFSMSYLLLGALFLGIGAQANSVREVQTLSMPVTMIQVVVLLAAQIGIGKPFEWEAITAALFPLTSPFAMIARAAELDTLWTHAAAIVWQVLWLVVILRVAGRLFRKSVLKSGKPWRWPWAKKAVAG